MEQEIIYKHRYMSRCKRFKMPAIKLKFDISIQDDSVKQQRE